MRLQARWLHATIPLLIAICVYHLTFFQFFLPDNPSAMGIGHDYAGILPIYLDGYYWFLNNGIFTPPWFSPAFCGGQPCFADPQSLFYSPGQFLSFLVDPLTASYIALLLFSLAGYVGMYAYCRQSLRTDSLPAGLAATLWIFNGFSTHHYLVGHVNFVAFLLAPLIAWLLLAPRATPFSELLSRSSTAALLAFVSLHSGLGSLMLPFGLSILGMGCLAILRGGDARNFYCGGAMAGISAIILAAGKLTVTAHLMSNFPRSQYKLAGIDGLDNLLHALVLMLFNADEKIIGAVAPLYTNRQLGLGSHELAFDVTLVPLGLIAPAIIIGLARGFRTKKVPSRLNLIHSAILVSLLAVPLAINYYSPEWNATLKSLPIISSTSAPWRWFIVFIPLLCAGSALAIHAILEADKRLRGIIAIAAIAAILVLKFSQPRMYYLLQPYNPESILSAYETAQVPGFKPVIRQLGTYTDGNGNPRRTGHQNDLIAEGTSQIFCYNPMFGYGLENFPLGKLHRGSPLEADDGYLNIKNPACYVYAEENGCRPGDHFRDSKEDRERAVAFINYRPWNFNRPNSQKLADAISLIALIALLSIPLAGGLRKILGITAARRLSSL